MTKKVKSTMTSDRSNDENIIPELLKCDQAAVLVGVGTRTLWTWSHSGIAPKPVKINGKTVRYRRSELKDWIDAGCPSCRAKPIKGIDTFSVN